MYGFYLLHCWYAVLLTLYVRSTAAALLYGVHVPLYVL